MKTNKMLIGEAWESLTGRWGGAVSVAAVYMIINIVMRLIPKAGGLIALLIAGPLALGFVIYWLNFSRRKEVNLEMIFSGFSNFGHALGLYLLMVLFILLWSLLLIVPGIIAGLSYSMAFYIMADEGTVGIKEALNKSKKMMYGHKLKYFYLNLRFVGWFILSILTLGVGFLWLIPYVSVTSAKFYDEIKDKTPETQS